MILDNADWLPESARVLRQAGSIEVDMTGFAPINDYTCTSFSSIATSLSNQRSSDNRYRASAPTPTTGSGGQWKNG